MSDLLLSEQVTGLIKNAWNVQVKAVTAYFNKYDTDFYYQEVAAGRNRAVYLLGHLTASNDSLLPMLGLGERLHPELESLFLGTPDKQLPDTELPSFEEHCCPGKFKNKDSPGDNAIGSRIFVISEK